MGYHYDPILCMNVPDSTSKAKDASWKAWTLYIDGKWVKSFNSSMAPIKEAQKFMKENYPGKVGKLTRNTGSSSGYSISGSEYKDEAPAEMRGAKAIDKAIRTCDDENERWITMNGSHVKIDGEGNAVAGNEKVKSIINSKKKSETAGKSEKKQAEGSKKKTYKSYSDFKKNSGAEDLLQFVDEVAFDAGHDEKDPDKEDLKRIGKEFQDVYEKIKDHPNVGEYVNKMRREINDKIEDEIGTTLYDYSYLRIKELNDTLKIFNKYYD